jgi:cell division transport system permease protein
MVHFVAVLTIAISLFAGALALAGYGEVRSVLDAWGGDVELTVYLDDAIDDEAIHALAETLRRDSDGGVTFVSKAEALTRLSRDLGDLGSVLEGLPSNPLPATLEVHPGARFREAGSIRALAIRWQGLKGITGVDFGREWLDRLEGWGRGLRTGGLIGALLIFGAAIVVVSATLQLAVYARREEIEIQKLVGATDSFVKAPMVLEGLIQGIGGSLLASAGLFAIDVFAGKRVSEALHFVAPSLPPFAFAAPHRLIEVAVAGAVLGLVGSFLAVGRFLKV